jgi:hypothetical protein
MECSSNLYRCLQFYYNHFHYSKVHSNENIKLEWLKDSSKKAENGKTR